MRMVANGVAFAQGFPLKLPKECEISSSHGGEYEVQNCLLGCTADDGDSTHL
jgi:hypothetical protein